ncbi:hypothetical protein M422DRAFT_262921 [Sphaerobolus stellatus SS14]|uniref:non-specific serine/threonine protein kinase n=1 Tax=Sphaerobolus stellatus (strain SS14) TaxID=990650 RepID=A0A0C9UJC0_SPHS4|nr:hypothetical protein M422DRAFT_262921 [Sphaerobolus stellatus SS14]
MPDVWNRPNPEFPGVQNSWVDRNRKVPRPLQAEVRPFNREGHRALAPLTRNSPLYRRSYAHKHFQPSLRDDPNYGLAGRVFKLRREVGHRGYGGVATHNEAFVPSNRGYGVVHRNQQVWGHGERRRTMFGDEFRVGFNRLVSGHSVRCFFTDNICLDKKLGEGGNGTVLRCYFRDSPHPYAIKLSRHDVHAASLETECENLEALSRLAPDCIVPFIGRVYDRRHIEQEDVERYHGRRVAPPPIASIVLQYMPHGDFGSLTSLLSRSYAFSDRGTPHPEVARFYIVDILMKLYGIHQAGYFHGDVKPANMMMTPEGRVLLADFGTARVDFRDNWSEGVAGTFCLMAPELFTYVFEGFQDYAGPRTYADLWSVGVILHWLIFGYSPYNGSAEEEIYRDLNAFVREQRWPEIDPSDLLARHKWEALRFIKKLLVWSPYSRPTWNDIINDSYVHDQWIMMKTGTLRAPLVHHNGRWMPTPEWDSLL